MSEFFLERYRKMDPDVSLDVTPRQAIRVNTTKISDEKLVKILTDRGVIMEKIPWLQHGYYAEAEFSLGSTKEYLLGWYYLQGPLSQLACEVLNPDSITMDMAAAPGGKTTYLAQMTEEPIIAMDLNPTRLAAVRNNVERLGLPNVICVKKDSRFAPDLKKTFKFILLDAPCSGNFCSEENWAAKRTIEDIKRNARVQKELLKAAYRCLEPGGKLLYCTCSLEPEEDEEVMKWFLHKYEDMQLHIPELPIGDASEFGTRFWPHKTGCEGFFMALIEKVGRQ